MNALPNASDGPSAAMQVTFGHRGLPATPFVEGSVPFATISSAPGPTKP
jgi:hypothetical protein